MPQLLDRYRRVSDGKEFAVVSLGRFPQISDAAAIENSLTLEAEDGERVESGAWGVRGRGRFEPLDD